MEYPISFREIEKALLTLQNGLAKSKDEFVRDACIQRFEYTFELTWKLSKKVLNHLGISSSSPRSVIRECAQQGWFGDAELWMKFLDDRNLTSHTYNKEVAERVYETASKFAPECAKLIQKLKEQSLKK